MDCLFACHPDSRMRRRIDRCPDGFCRSPTVAALSKSAFLVGYDVFRLFSCLLRFMDRVFLSRFS